MLTLKSSPELLELPRIYPDPLKKVEEKMDADLETHYDGRLA